MTLIEVLQGANVALRLIQARVLTLIALLLTAVAYGWAMYLQTWLGAMIATVWGLSIFWPVLWIGRGGYDDGQVGQTPKASGSRGEPEEGQRRIEEV